MRAQLLRLGPSASLGLGFALGASLALVFDYLRGRLQARYARRAAAEWEAHNECWAVSGYADVCELLKSPHIRANYLPSFFARLPPGIPVSRFAFLADFFERWPLFQDGPRQRRTHAVLARLFGSARLKNLDMIVHEEIEALLQPLQAHGVRALGFKLADAEDFMRWADDIENWFGGQGDVEERFDKCQRALKLFSSRAHELICTFAAQGEGRGGGDGEESGAGEGRTIAEELVLACEKGELERDDVVPNLFFLMSAGHETTASLISNGILLCLDRPEVLRQLKLVAWRARGGGDGTWGETERDGGRGAELELEFDDLITEMLRIITPVTRAYREVAADFKYKGIDMKKGQQVLVTDLVDSLE